MARPSEFKDQIAKILHNWLFQFVKFVISDVKTK